MLRVSRLSTARSDLVLAILVVGVVYVGVAASGVVDTSPLWKSLRNQYDFDEILIALAVGTFAFAWYAWRRWRELDREVDGRREALEKLEREAGARIETQTELERANGKLELLARELAERNRRTVLLSEVTGMLQTCASPVESHRVLERMLPKVLPGQPGVLYLYSASRDELEAVAVWGEGGPACGERGFAPDECWAVRRGALHVVRDPASDLVCTHVDPAVDTGYACAPMMAHGEVLGILHLRIPAGERAGEDADELNDRVVTVARQIGLAQANLALRETLRTQSIRDPLTGLFNRRYMEETLQREMRRAERQDAPLAVVMFDIDHFKRFNDTFGHEAGDFVLGRIGRLVRDCFRAEDVPCRFGGEEFVVVMPQAGEVEARDRAEDLRRTVSEVVLDQHGRTLGSVSISAGIAAAPPHGRDPHELVAAADRALYAAKREGRDRVLVAEVSGGGSAESASGDAASAWNQG